MKWNILIANILNYKILSGGAISLYKADALSKRILFFDTETSGLNPGSICQLSYLILDGNNIEAKNYFFKVDYVEPGAERIHGLSVEKLCKLSNNRTFNDNLYLLHSDFHNADLLVGHNISFDLKFILAEYRKCGRSFSLRESFCTMRYFTNICKIPHYRGYGYKWPRLEELTQFFNINDTDIRQETESIFDCQDVGYHDARFDTVATYLAYIEGLRRGEINIY